MSATLRRFRLVSDRPRFRGLEARDFRFPSGPHLASCPRYPPGLLRDFWEISGIRANLRNRQDSRKFRNFEVRAPRNAPATLKIPGATGSGLWEVAISRFSPFSQFTTTPPFSPSWPFSPLLSFSLFFRSLVCFRCFCPCSFFFSFRGFRFAYCLRCFRRFHSFHCCHCCPCFHCCHCLHCLHSCHSFHCLRCFHSVH